MCLFPVVDLEAWREAMFGLCWFQHGGSGLGISLGAALELDVGDRDWLVERVSTQRSREARELERAARRK